MTLDLTALAGFLFGLALPVAWFAATKTSRALVTLHCQTQEKIDNLQRDVSMRFDRLESGRGPVKGPGAGVSQPGGPTAGASPQCSTGTASESQEGPPGTENTSYWSEHNVTYHRRFTSREESIHAFHDRNSGYLHYERLMPVAGFDDQVVMDYGCGPGHDLVGLIEFSAPRRVIGMDISPVSLREAGERLKLHRRPVELIQVKEGDTRLPLEDESVDYVHSSGVLHHMTNMEPILGEFRRVMKPDAKCRIMVYNYDSIFLHLYIAYQRQIIQGIDTDLPVLEAFRRACDTTEQISRVPESRCYKPAEFIDILSKLGFDARLVGCAISTSELSMLNARFDAIVNDHLAWQHRDFLRNLRFDEYGLPCSNSHVAGIDAVYEVTKRRHQSSVGA